ncbi:MAG TPA: SHOCT domain-containing protein, partial [Acidimicrobiia bacterium]
SSVAANPSADFIADQIKKLGELRKAGLLTDDEFNEKKRQLLARL